MALDAERALVILATFACILVNWASISVFCGLVAIDPDSHVVAVGNDGHGVVFPIIADHLASRAEVVDAT